MASIVMNVARQGKDLEIAAVYTRRGERAGWARTGETTAVPSIIEAEIHLNDPALVVQMMILVTDDGRPRVAELHLSPNLGIGSITTTLLRKLPVDQLVRTAMDRSVKTITPRTDIHEGAYQVPGESEDQAWVGQAGRGRAVPDDRVRRAAEIYRQAVSDGSPAPTLAVAKAMNYSRPTAARDIRLAREAGLLPPTAGMVGEAEDVAPNLLTPPSNPSVPANPVWRRFDDPEKWASKDDVLTGPAGLPVYHPGQPVPNPVPMVRDASKPDRWLEKIQDAAAQHRQDSESESSASDDAGAAEEADQ